MSRLMVDCRFGLMGIRPIMVSETWSIVWVIFQKSRLGTASVSLKLTVSSIAIKEFAYDSSPDTALTTIKLLLSTLSLNS